MNLKLLRAIGWLLMRVNLFWFCFIKYIKAKKEYVSAQSLEALLDQATKSG